MNNNHANAINLNEIRRLNPRDLIKRAEQLSAESEGVRSKDLINSILKKCAELNKEIIATGVLDVVNENYGFLRYIEDNYNNTGEDIFVSGNLVKRFNLKKGDLIKCVMRLPGQGEKYYTLARILSVNGLDPNQSRLRSDFEQMTAVYPSRKMTLELKENYTGKLSLRILDFIAPIGFGQRALIVAAPKTGKTTLMQNIAHAISANHPEAHLIILLVGERPEEVTDMRRSTKGEVISSTFDEPPTQHVHVADITLARAKRMAEMGRDVVVLMDSITRFARSNNTVIPASGKILTGGIDANALQRPKQFFGAARDLEEGGSLTIIATTLVETGSKADEVIHEEFKGTGNSEIVLDRKIADRRSYPAMNLNSSGTRKEELLLEPKICGRLKLLRRVLSPMGIPEAAEFLIHKVSQTENNEQFFDMMTQNNS